MQGSVPSASVPSTCTAAEASARPLISNEGSYDMLKTFVEASHSRGIVSGVQVKLLMELAEELATPSAGAQTVAPSTSEPASLQHAHQPPAAVSVPPAEAYKSEGPSREATPAAQLQAPAANNSDNSSLTATAAPQTCPAQEATTSILQPQLHIQPLNLNSHLGPSTAPPAVSSSPETVLQLGQALRSTSNSFTQQGSGLLGFSPALIAAAQAAVAAATAQQQQQQLPTAVELDTHTQAATQQYCNTTDGNVSAGSAEAGCHGYTAAAAWASCAAGVRQAAARKHRFSKEQHAAILESVERNYALYPSRYTELVIKEMQSRFPGIEINNACVRKIKFRANEATKQVIGVPQSAAAAAASPGAPICQHDLQAAAEAAHGLVGLASAAAAAAAANEGCLQHAHSAPVDTAAGPVAIAGGLQGARQADSSCGGGDGHAATAADVCMESHPAAAAAVDRLQREQQQQQQQQQQQEVAAPAGLHAVQASQQQEPQQQQEKAEPHDAATVAAAAETVTVAAEDTGIDSAAVAAAEAMHMLASCSSMSEFAIEGATAAVPAVAVPAAATGPVGGSLKRKFEHSEAAAAAAAPDSSCTALGVSAAAPTANQIADALAAAAGLASTSTAAEVAATSAPAAQQQLQQPVGSSQSLQWHPAAAMLQAGAAAAGAAAPQQDLQQQLQALQQLQQQRQQQQQQALMQYSSTAAAPSPAAGLDAASSPAAAVAAAAAPASKRQRLNGVQMAELVASVRHHVQVNPERYTHCVIKDMKEKYPDLELNMGQIRKIKFRTLGNANPRPATKLVQQCQQDSSPCDPAAAAAAMPQPLTLAAADAGSTPYKALAASGPTTAMPMNQLATCWGTSWHARSLEAVAAAAAAAAASGANGASPFAKLPQVQ